MSSSRTTSRRPEPVKSFANEDTDNDTVMAHPHDVRHHTTSLIDPFGRTKSQRTRPSGLRVTRVRISNINMSLALALAPPCPRAQLTVAENGTDALAEESPNDSDAYFEGLGNRHAPCTRNSRENQRRSDSRTVCQVAFHRLQARNRQSTNF